MHDPLPTTTKGESALHVAERAARDAGALILQRLPEMTGPLSERSVEVSNKGWNNLVTEVDRAAEEAVLATLREAFPGFSVLAEESGGTTGTEPYTWYIDPIDGTRNFASGIPHLAVNVALEHDGTLLAGVTLDPVRDELFSAVAGRGAFLNGRPIRASAITELRESILGFDMGYVDDKGRMLLETLISLWPGIQSIRMMGSAALGIAYAAAGRIQVYGHHHVQPWDIAPGLLLAREAGGVASDLHGAEAGPASGSIVVGRPEVHARFMAATAGSPWRTTR